MDNGIYEWMKDDKCYAWAYVVDNKIIVAEAHKWEFDKKVLSSLPLKDSHYESLRDNKILVKGLVEKGILNFKDAKFSPYFLANGIHSWEIILEPRGEHDDKQYIFLETEIKGEEIVPRYAYHSEYYEFPDPNMASEDPDLFFQVIFLRLKAGFLAEKMGNINEVSKKSLTHFSYDKIISDNFIVQPIHHDGPWVNMAVDHPYVPRLPVDPVVIGHSRLMGVKTVMELKNKRDFNYGKESIETYIGGKYYLEYPDKTAEAECFFRFIGNEDNFAIKLEGGFDPSFENFLQARVIVGTDQDGKEIFQIEIWAEEIDDAQRRRVVFKGWSDALKNILS